MNQFITPNLEYDYNALEPYIDEETMKIHHDKHHAGYTTKLNNALESQPELYKKTAEEILANLDLVNEDKRLAVKNNGGGHVHHNFFWEILRPGKDNNMPEGELLDAITNTFGSWDKFKKEFSNTALTTFGSGWTWLSLDNVF